MAHDLDAEGGQMSVEVKLEDWLRSQGCIFPKLRIGGAGGDRSVHLTADVAAGEEVAHIPSHCLITAQASARALKQATMVSQFERARTRHGCRGRSRGSYGPLRF